MAVIPVELTVLIFVSLSGISLDFSRPLNEIFVLNLYKHLGNEGIKRWQYQVGLARWCT